MFCSLDIKSGHKILKNRLDWVTKRIYSLWDCFLIYKMGVVITVTSQNYIQGIHVYVCAYIYMPYLNNILYPGGARGKEHTCQCRRHKRHGFNFWVRKIPWRRKWQPTQHSCLENPMDRGAWWATVHGAAKSWTWLQWLSLHACRVSSIVVSGVLSVTVITKQQLPLRFSWSFLVCWGSVWCFPILDCLSHTLQTIQAAFSQMMSTLKWCSSMESLCGFFPPALYLPTLIDMDLLQKGLRWTVACSTY